MRVTVTGLIIFLLASSAFADQLHSNTHSISQMAKETIRPYSVLVSYCSMCDESPIEVWRVIRSISYPKEKNVNSYTLVVAERIFVSERTYGKGRYQPQIPFRRVSQSATPHERVVAQEIDLAYVYVSSGNNRFRCLGKVLELDCSVEVEELVLPQDIFDSVSVYVGPEEEYRGNKYVPEFNVAGERM